MEVVMFGVDAGFALPAVGDERAIGGSGVVKAGDVVAFRVGRGIGRLQIVTEEHRAGVRRIGLEHLPRPGIHGHPADPAAGGKNEVAAMHVVPRRFPPAGAELVACGARVVGEHEPVRQRDLDPLEHRLDGPALGGALVGAGDKKPTVGQIRASKPGKVVGVPAGKGDVTKQSQFSRQIKELEAYFGVALTRRVGRRIEITSEGGLLAGLIRRHFGELDDFREAMNGRPVCVRIGSQGSLIDWLLLPRLAACRDALGGALIELEQLRSADIARGVADGRLDFGMVREDAIARELKRWPLGRIGYALFAPKSVWKAGVTVAEVLGTVPVGELLPGGQYSARWREWLSANGIKPQVAVRMPSFVHLARMTRESGLAAVLPEIAKVDFDEKKIVGKPMPWDHDRQIALIANTRSLDRAGIRAGADDRLAGVLGLG